ncbi:MAG: alanine--glyoxylate aminotransferase family protein [bacterium]|nr:alanine--glyoxylate aminotransferase family protein [bacterium]
MQPPIRTLMGPGPSDVHPRVLAALARPIVGHLDPYFLRLMDDLQQKLRMLMRTENEMTFAVSGTGSAGMETTIVNLVEPGDKVLACTNGVFGGRMADVAQRAGAEVATIERPWGEVFTPADIKAAIEEHQPQIVGIVSAETSTGAWQPLAEIADIVHNAGALLVVDAVTSLGGVAMEVDDWGIDALYSGTQKCLSCPPGLAPVTFGEAAMNKVNARKTKVRSWYLDITMLANYWGDQRAYHHTAPISMNYALHEAVSLIHEEGLENVIARHLRHHLALKAGLEAIGLEYNADPNHQLPMLNAVKIPDGVDDAAIRGGLLNRFGIEIGGGLGAFKGKVWRIGLMGYAARSENVFQLLSALEQLLAETGHQFTAGSSIAAANQQYAAG